MKKNISGWLCAAVMAAAAILISVSSKLAYPLSDLKWIVLASIAAIACELELIFWKKDNALRDLALLAAVALVSWSLSAVVTGRADLMGYVWFSDLEKGNPTAVLSLNLAAGAMGCMLLAIILNIVSAFRKRS